MSHGTHAPKRGGPALETSAARVFAGKITHAAHEGSGKMGLGGLQFAAEALANPWFLLNAMAESGIAARHNREILREMDEANEHLEGVYEQLKIHPNFRGYFAVSPQELTLLERGLTDDCNTMRRHLDRMNKDQAKELEMLKNYRGRSLTVQEMGLFIKFADERRKLISQFRALRAGNFADVKQLKEAFGKLEAQNKYLQSKNGEFLIFGMLEARAVRDAEKAKG